MLSKIAILLTIIFCVQGEKYPKVKINDTTIIGHTIKSVLNQDIHAFHRIPYAEPPVDNKRFKDPEPIVYRVSPIMAMKDGPFCPQNGLDLDKQSEDCLILNVYTKNLTGILPVLFYIHGGGLKTGGSHSNYSVNPNYLLDRDVVLVTINYRLGPLGFLSTGTKDAVGNFGFKDQVLALKWVQKYIRFFGGNSQRVTIFGNSAGGMSVSLHLASKMSIGLFNNAIMLSGASTSGIKPDNIGLTSKLAKTLKCENENKAQVIDCLRKVHYPTILKACADWEVIEMPSMHWNYEIEKDFGQERFLTEDPTESYANGRLLRVPIMAGITTDEFASVAHYALKYNPKFLDNVNSNFTYYYPQIFQYSNLAERRQEITQSIKKFYLNDQNVTSKNIDKFGEIYADSIINHGVHRLVELARKEHIQVYYYRFDYKGRFTSGMYSESGVPLTVSHTDELQYLFVDQNYSKQFTPADKEYMMVKKLTNYFAAFARYNNPNNGSSELELNATKWMPSNLDTLQTLYINETCKMGQEPFQERFKFWDNLFPLKKDGDRSSANGLKVYSNAFILITFAIISIKALWI